MLRTVALWVGLVVVFLVVYAFFDSRRSAPDEELDLGRWVGISALVFFVVFMTVVVRQRAAYKVNNDAHAQLHEGRVLEALAAFERAKAKMSNPIPLMNIGYAQLLLWRVKDAAENLEAFAKRSGSLTGVPGGEGLAAPSAALAHALLGNAEQAKRWLAVSSGPAMSRLAEVVLACRAGDFAEASRLLRAHEVVLDQLGGTLRALAEAVSALVASKTGGAGGAVDPARLFRESSPEALAPVWPELYEFVVRAARGPAVA